MLECMGHSIDTMIDEVDVAIEGYRKAGDQEYLGYDGIREYNITTYKPNMSLNAIDIVL